MIGAMAEALPGRVRAEVQLGDFGAWMASEQKRVFLLCRRMLQDSGEADSATQDIFLKAFKAMNSSGFELDDPEGQGRWLTRIAVNTCLDYLRSRSWKFWKSRPAPEDEALILQLTASREPDAERQLFARQIQQRLEQALEKLSARQRAVFCLRHYEGLPLEQIATTLTLDQGTVKVHLFRAIAKLREELKDLYQAAKRGDLSGVKYENRV
jgi:RNA polymerase sigma-70 factor, ECF subfamily